MTLGILVILVHQGLNNQVEKPII